MYVAVSILGRNEMSLPMIINTPVALVICIAFVTFVRWWQSVRGPELEPDGSRFRGPHRAGRTDISR